MSITAIHGPSGMPAQLLWNNNLNFSTAEKRILNLEKEGKPIKEIAGTMHLSPREVQRLIVSIKSKLKNDNADGHTGDSGKINSGRRCIGAGGKGSCK